MKVIKPYIKEIMFYLPENGDSVNKEIEKVARTCYQSHDHTKEGSDKTIVRNLRDRGHHAMLEFGGDARVTIVADRGLCYDDQTEVLTYNGWKKFEDTTDEDLFLTMNIDKKHAEYQKRLGYTEEDWNDELICGTSTMVDFAVTPNHRMYWYHYDARNRAWKINKAEEIYGKRVKFLRGLHKDMKQNCFTKDSPYLYLYPQIHKLDFARFMGIWMTDGCLWKGEDTGGRVSIAQTKKSGRKYIRKVLKGLEWKFQERPDGFRINDTKLYTFLRKWFPANQKKTYDGRCPSWIRHANSNYIRAFLEGVIVGDGNIHKTNGHRVVYTASYGFASDLQELFMKAGKCASIRIDDRRGQSRELKNETTITNKVVQYIVSVTDRTNEHLFNKKHWHKKHYKGKVRCVTVPNGTLYVRRNGKAFWSGNTHELVRHRIASFAQESTRYCNYNKGKFGSEITVIEQPDMTDDQYNMWQQAMQDCERYYLKLIEMGVKAQIARSVLPIGVKSEINIKASMREWRHIFKMRCAPAAHPIIREIMLDLLVLFSHKVPILFDDLVEEFLS